MDPETLDAMSSGIYLNLLVGMMVKTVALIVGLAAATGFAIYLIGIAWLCLSEARQAKQRRIRHKHSALKPPKPDEYDLLVTLACLNSSLSAESMRREQQGVRHAQFAPAAPYLTKDFRFSRPSGSREAAITKGEL